ncbi:HupE/UreJ family protein [Chitinimonas naiadis]
MKKYLIAALLALSSGLALAHKPSDSYLTLTETPTRPQLQWDIALRDLDVALGLDADQDGKVNWRELQAAEPRLQQYAFSRLTISADKTACPLVYRGMRVDRHVDGTYAVLDAELACPIAASYQVGYHFLFDLDRLHKGIVTLHRNGHTQTAIASADHPSVLLVPGRQGVIAQFADFIKEGVWHIWIGYDHILFLISLLLPAVMVFKQPRGGWQPASELRPVLKDAIGVVTAFTLAHSITLCLAALDVVRLPSRLVESVIAVSVLLAALNNLYPIIHRRRWLVTFAFGLIHGFGFASALAELDLGRGSLLVSLLGFNLGVELGQLAILLGFLPLAFWLRDQQLYRRLALQTGSCVIAVIAAGWLTERVLDLKLMPF